MGDVGVNGRIILERNVKKLGIRMWTRCNWFMITSSGRLLVNTQNTEKFRVPQKVGSFLISWATISCSTCDTYVQTDGQTDKLSRATTAPKKYGGRTNIGRPRRVKAFRQQLTLGSSHEIQLRKGFCSQQLAEAAVGLTYIYRKPDE
jgi:hypothetical protein